MSTTAKIEYPTKFRAKFWTTVSGPAEFDTPREIWAVIMLDGDAAGAVCAYGAKSLMKMHANKLNKNELRVKHLVERREAWLD